MPNEMDEKLIDSSYAWSRLIAIKHCKEIHRLKISNQVKAYIKEFDIYDSYSITSLVKPYENCTISECFIFCMSAIEDAKSIKRKFKYNEAAIYCNYLAIAVKSKDVNEALVQIKNFEEVGLFDIDKMSWIKFPKLVKVSEACKKELMSYLNVSVTQR